MEYFTEQKIKHLTENHNWELVCDGSNYLLRQKDKHYMKTVNFDLTDDVADKLMLPLARET